MPSSRLVARLGQLPHIVLAELAAQLCCESAALQATAEEYLAAHNPLLHEMVQRVLLSPDLVPHILGPLGLEDGVAAQWCAHNGVLALADYIVLDLNWNLEDDSNKISPPPKAGAVRPLRA